MLMIQKINSRSLTMVLCSQFAQDNIEMHDRIKAICFHTHQISQGMDTHSNIAHNLPS